MNQLYARDPINPTLQVSPDNAVGEVVNVERILHGVLRYKWGILGLAFAITLLAILWAYSLPSIYRASASLVLESQEANVVNVEQVYSMGVQNYDYYQTQFEVLKSRSLAERVVRQLDLHERRMFAGSRRSSGSEEAFSLSDLWPSRDSAPAVELTPEQLQEQAIQRATSYVAGGLDVAPVEFSHMVHLRFESTDPELAAEIANAAAQSFIDSNLEHRLSGTLQATDWLSERLESLKENLRDSEQALQAFREGQGLVDVDGVTDTGSNELRTLSQRLQDASKSRIEAENIREDVQDLSSASTSTLMTIPAVLQHPLVRDLKRDHSQAERKVAELGKRYGVKHPRMIAAQSELASASRDLSREVQKVVSGINREYDLALRTEEQLQDVWDERKSEIQDFNRVEFRLRELQREVEANRQLYEIFFTRIKSVSETGGFEKPHARIIDHALVPGSPVKPNRQLIILVALFSSLALGCVLAVLLDYLDDTIKVLDDVAQKLDVPLFGAIPVRNLDDAGSFQQFWEDTQSVYAESIRTIRTGVLLSNLDNPAGVIVITSTVPGEGKSTVALNLAAAMGQMENVLVIGGDLRRPSLAQKCDLPPNQQGLSHFVSGMAKLEECIVELDEHHLHVMPAGVIPMNPLEMISSRQFVHALGELRSRYDRIIIDSAPVLSVSDALVLASYADSVIYVVKADDTPATQVARGIARMVDSNGPLTGVVLNQYNPRHERKMFGSKGYDYYDKGYYGRAVDSPE